MKKILIIEDEEIILELLQKKLKMEGYEVSVARDGQTGLEAVKSFKPDLILLDLVMPKIGGFEVMEEIAKDGALKEIPIIVISNSGEALEIDKAQALGAKDWLIKTEFDPNEVIEKIIKQIGI